MKMLPFIRGGSKIVNCLTVCELFKDYRITERSSYRFGIAHFGTTKPLANENEKSGK